jgi:hypothetical protein
MPYREKKKEGEAFDTASFLAGCRLGCRNFIGRVIYMIFYDFVPGLAAYGAERGWRRAELASLSSFPGPFNHFF